MWSVSYYETLMQVSDRKMECAQLIILLYYGQFQNQEVEADMPQIN